MVGRDFPHAGLPSVLGGEAMPALIGSASWPRSSWANADISVSVALPIGPVALMPPVTPR
ncbi:hypothetical protein [Arthrobacter zhaoguopingii]|uniref:hypothetical protein n=1 Tax=Arthrobacter zhaoguopingii TaxID=2681491 RepID=UPI001FE6E918|nr:hypothetical protein [Arthrobacter zhaoguopingii]